MDLNQVLAPARPLMALAAQVLIIAGLLKFAGINIPITGSGLEIAVAGFLLKNV